MTDYEDEINKLCNSNDYENAVDAGQKYYKNSDEDELVRLEISDILFKNGADLEYSVKFLEKTTNKENLGFDSWFLTDLVNKKEELFMRFINDIQSEDSILKQKLDKNIIDDMKDIKNRLDNNDDHPVLHQYQDKEK